MAAPPLRWGVLGPGGIAKSFVTALGEGTQQVLQAVGSRDLGRAQRFASEHGARAAYGSYADLLADPDVDIVYVATPHSEHRQQALDAMAAGKHVLVEKAFARNEREAADIVRAATSSGRFCAEAMWSRYLPHYDIVRQAVEGGLLGEVRQIIADHGQNLYPNGPRRMTDPALAAGALLDLGVYPVSFAAMLMPGDLRVDAVGKLTDLGVDKWESITLQGNEISAALSTTMLALTPNTAAVCGTEGRLEIDGWFYNPNTVRLVDADGDVLDEWTPPDRALGLRYEAAEAARCVSDGRTETSYMPPTETLRVMGLMDHVRAAIGVRYPGE